MELLRVTDDYWCKTVVVKKRFLFFTWELTYIKIDRVILLYKNEGYHKVHWSEESRVSEFFKIKEFN